MSRSLRVVPLAALLVLARAGDASAFLPRGRIEVSVEFIVNAADGSVRSACPHTEQARLHHKRELWLSVTEADPREEGDPSGAVLCGSDSLAPQSPDSADTAAAPYLVAEVSTVSRVVRQMEDERLLVVAVSVATRRRSGVADGEARYERTEERREFFFSESRDAFVPLLIANESEQESLGIYEIFLGVTARLVREASASVYGTVQVTTGAGSDLLLDRGVAAILLPGREVTLHNVPIGLREMRVRDASGEEIRKVVRVEASRTSRVDLRAPDAQAGAPPYRLVPLGPNDQGYEEFRRTTDGAVVVMIPAGEFLMGNRETERNPLEHRVWLSDFRIDVTGVTWGQFMRFAEATGIPLPEHEPYWGIHDDHPMVYVTWEEAKSYCEWAGARLPTEAEREKAARGSDGRMYPWGNEAPNEQRAVFRHTWGYEATGAVGTRPDGASPYGVHDMGGNVWEWCADWYDDGYYAESPDRDPKGPPSGRAHVVRGGSWDSRPSVLSASCRSWGHRGYRDGDFGFRCAMSAPD